jgi:hypothetical protein
MFALILLVFTTYIALGFLSLRFRFAFLLVLTFVLLSQNLLTMIALRFGWVPLTSGDAFVYAKEVILASSLAGLALFYVIRGLFTEKLRFHPIETLIVLYFAYLLVPFLLSNASGLFVRVAGLRFLMLIPMLYLLGRWLQLSPERTIHLYRLLVIVATLLAAFGLLEAYILPDSFWLSVGHEEYYLMKRGRPIQGELFANMRFWVPWSSDPIRRVASLTGDPLISSYPMAFVLVLFFARSAIRKSVKPVHVVLGLMIFAAVVLTFSRGALLVMLVAAIVILFSNYNCHLFRGITVLGFLAAVVLVLGLGQSIAQYTSGKGHIDGLTFGLQKGIEHPLGLGVGTAGSVAAGIVFSSPNSGEDTFQGADSFVGSTAIQTGIVGLILLYTLLLMMCVDLYRQGIRLNKQGYRHAWLYFGTAAMLAGLLVTSTVNESGYGFVASGLIFVFAGVLADQANRLLKLDSQSLWTTLEPVTQ